MKFREEDNAHEDIPECGAIFMASIFTKKECLERRLLALPSAKAHFVKHIKAGMLLFLFEYGKKQLYGVFQATTDGAVDIVPDAFQGRFPAQVCRLFCCDGCVEFDITRRANIILSSCFQFPIFSYRFILNQYGIVTHLMRKSSEILSKRITLLSINSSLV